MEGQSRKRPVRLPERLMFRCSTTLAEQLRHVAEREEISPSELTRRIVQERLRDRSQQPLAAAG